VPDLLIRFAALCCVFCIAAAHGAEAENAQSAGQISSKREQACKNRKGADREQCLNGYVGPEEGQRYGRDSVYSNKPGATRPKTLKSQGDWTRPGRY
jgi:hypothetical protein